MNGLFLATVFHLSVAFFLLGMGWRCLGWLRAPVPLKIPLTPGPKTRVGVAARLAGETIAFRSLFRAAPGLWVVAWLFHLSLVLLLIGHFGGLVAPKFSQRLLGLTAEQFTAQAQLSGGAIGILAAASLLGLLLRRIASKPLRAISTAGDFFLLLLLLLIVATGLAMRFAGQIDLREARAFVSGMRDFKSAVPSPDSVFTTHLLLVCALLVYAPFSKLVHMAGVFFNPALNQTNTPRERRHIGSGLGPARVVFPPAKTP
ncbi:MAG: respiratory nitrate reductase subunit gamma [Opitutaceae bacterium]|nr:respiratory nitrate reductase subunit gamma [Opitutaceae bacterium]